MKCVDQIRLFHHHWRESMIRVLAAFFLALHLTAASGLAQGQEDWIVLSDKTLVGGGGTYQVDTSDAYGGRHTSDHSGGTIFDCEHRLQAAGDGKLVSLSFVGD